MLTRANLENPPKGLGIEAVLLGTDGGKRRAIGRQRYLTRLDGAAFLDDSVQGMTLGPVEEGKGWPERGREAMKKKKGPADNLFS